MSLPGPGGMQDDAGTLLQVRDLRVNFLTSERESVPAVRGISFAIPEDATVALVGESGSGKTVTGLAVMGLLPRGRSVIDPAARIQYRGRELTALDYAGLRALRGAEMSMIFQDPMSSLNPVFSVGFQIGEVLRLHLGLDAEQARVRTIALLDEVGIPESARRVDSYPFDLSGGQQQRAMIAMAIACGPRLLIADEPTTALDVTIQKQIIELLAQLKVRQRMSMLFISHDLALVGEIADWIVVMRQGEIREQGPADRILGAPQDAYTRALLACRPRLDRRRARLPVVADFLDADPDQVDASDRLVAHQLSHPSEPVTRAQAAQRDVDTPPALEVQGLSVSYSGREGLRRVERPAVREVNFRLGRGRTLGLVGESGCGKTTLARAIAGLVPVSAGVVRLDGRTLAGATRTMNERRRLQIVFQNPHASLNPRFTAGRLLMEPMRLHGIGAGEDERLERVGELLRRVGLPPEAAQRYPHEFSGGQRQRIAVARCLALEPDVLICDEAVSALDVSVQAQLLNLLQDLQDDFGMSYLFISHDLAVVRHVADEVLVMCAGSIVEQGVADTLFARPEHPYTRELLAAVPGLT